MLSGDTMALEMLTQLESIRDLGPFVHWAWLEMMDRCSVACPLLALGHETHSLLFLFPFLSLHHTLLLLGLPSVLS